jgi:hypothetical protein
MFHADKRLWKMYSIFCMLFGNICSTKKALGVHYLGTFCDKQVNP